VNFDLNDDQRAIQRTAKEFLASRYRPEEVRRLALEEEHGFTDEQWGAIAELGWPGIAIAEDDGGLGLGVLELCVVQEQLGYALAPAPFFSTIAAGLVLSVAEEEIRREVLPALAAGERRATIAGLDEHGGESADATTMQAHGSLLTGTKIVVPDAGRADLLVVAAEGGHHYVVDARAKGVTITPTPGLDPTRKLYKVHLDGVEGRSLGAKPEDLVRAYQAIVTALAAESVGIGQRALEMSVEYAKDRKQFGRPIGAYQAISHACAQMLLEVEGARSATMYAAWALDHEPPTGPLAASMAKAYATDAGWRVTAAALQVHGGIGFTWEHDLHFFLKRARANYHAWGDPRWHRSRVAELAGV
jgi:alkylation response protein AidB-like acyl-CoA dehydrogenase